MNCHVLSAYYVLGCTTLSSLHTLSWLVLLQPQQVGLFLASLYGWGNQGLERLRNFLGRSHSWTLAELGLDPGLCDSELALWTILMVLTELGSEKIVKRKGPQRNFQPFKKPIGILTFILERWILAKFSHFITQGNLILPFIDIYCF